MQSQAIPGEILPVRSRTKSGSGSGRGARELRTPVKKAKGRKVSSSRWLERQLNDPYVQRARREGIRSRAAYKLIELNEKYRFLRPGMLVVDLGCSPGGWSQVAARAVNSDEHDVHFPKGRVIGIDLNKMDQLPGVEFLQQDVMADDWRNSIASRLSGAVDAVISDMAAPATGHKGTDHLRVIALCEWAAELAFEVLAKDGTFVAKVLAGGAEGELQKQLKSRYHKVYNAKPSASRKDSSEKYVVATGFLGNEVVHHPTALN